MQVAVPLVPVAKSLAGLLAPLRGAAAQPRPSSFSRGFTPNPAGAARSPSAAVESHQLPALLPASGTSAAVESQQLPALSPASGTSATRFAQRATSTTGTSPNPRIRSVAGRLPRQKRALNWDLA